jgi:hypothetical protein
MLYIINWGKKMNNHKLLKIAGVLLLSAVLFLSATAVTANTKTLSTMTKGNGNYNGNSHPASRDVVWDNYADDGTGVGLSSQQDLVYPFDSQVADDFQLSSTADISGVHWWGAFWNGATYPNPVDFNILFYADDGTGNKPTGGPTDPSGTALAAYNFIAVMGTEYQGASYPAYEYEVALDPVFTATAGVKYWIAIQAICVFSTDGQWGWSTNGANPEQLHEGVQGFPLLGMNYWTTTTYGDQAFQLLGGAGSDTTPPVTVCTLSGTDVVTVTLTATDDMSGVNYTKYKLDDGAWTTYTAPFTVSESGDHTVLFYSVDIAGNVEDEKSASFTIAAPAITITIKGGLGVSATIKNTGTVDLTNITWTITLDGKMIFLGKTKTNTIAALAAGEEVIVKDFVIGFGKTGIAVEAGNVAASASGTVLLFLVIGVA